MERRCTDSTGRRKLAVPLLLLPGLMLIGLFAPNALTMKRSANPDLTASLSRVDFPLRSQRFAWRAPASAALPRAARLVDELFAGARYLANELQQVFELPQFAVAEDEGILLDDEVSVEEYVADTLLDESLELAVLTVDLTPLWDPAVFDVIPPLIQRDGFSMYDDFHGSAFRTGGAAPTPFVIPEPGTGGLLWLGLVALALRAKRTRA